MAPPVLPPDEPSSVPRHASDSPLVVTLEPFQPVAPRRRRAPRRHGPRPSPASGSEVETLPGIMEQASYAKFVVLRTAGGEDLREGNIFQTYRDLVEACGSAPKVVPQADGSLLVEVGDAAQSERLQALSTVGSLSISCTPHATLNQSRGVVYAKELLRFSVEELQLELADQGVVRVERVRKKMDGVLSDTPTLFVTFDSLRLPEVLVAA